MDHDLVKCIDELAISVAFDSIFETVTADTYRSGTFDGNTSFVNYPHWSSPYAQILLCEAPANEEGFKTATNIAQRRLDELLVDVEITTNSVVDGYLLIIIEGSPSDAMRSLIRQTELDTHLCKKHVIWQQDGPSGEKVWPRLSRVTVLGLPASMGVGPGAGLPAPKEYDPNGIWRMISDSNSPSAAAKHELEKNLLGESK